MSLKPKLDLRLNITSLQDIFGSERIRSLDTGTELSGPTRNSSLSPQSNSTTSQCPCRSPHLSWSSRLWSFSLRTQATVEGRALSLFALAGPKTIGTAQNVLVSQISNHGSLKIMYQGDLKSNFFRIVNKQKGALCGPCFSTHKVLRCVLDWHLGFLLG